MAFVNLQRILDLNKDKGEAMAREDIAKNDLTRGAESAIGYLGGGANNEAEAQRQMLSAQERAKTLAGGKARTSALDAALSGQSNAMQQYQQRTSNLATLMSGAQQAQQARQEAQGANARYRQNIAGADARLHARMTGGVEDVSEEQLTAAYDAWKDAEKSGNTALAAAKREEYRRLQNQRKTNRDSVADFQQKMSQSASAYANGRR